MYGSLYRKGTGGFRNTMYWASTKDLYSSGTINYDQMSDLSNGTRGNRFKWETAAVRACRQF